MDARFVYRRPPMPIISGGSVRLVSANESPLRAALCAMMLIRSGVKSPV